MGVASSLYPPCLPTEIPLKMTLGQLPRPQPGLTSLNSDWGCQSLSWGCWNLPSRASTRASTAPSLPAAGCGCGLAVLL